jgi:hypothetical protein
MPGFINISLTPRFGQRDRRDGRAATTLAKASLDQHARLTAHLEASGRWHGAWRHAARWIGIVLAVAVAIGTIAWYRLA